MRDVPELITELGGPTAFAKAIKVEVSTASEMKRRKSIPVRYWPAVIAAAKACGRDISSDDLMVAHEAIAS